MGGSVTPCIDENTIGALFDHRLTQREVDDIDLHVASCAACRDLLCGMARLYASSSPSRALLQTAPLGVGVVADDERNIRRLLALLGCERQVGRVLGGKWRLDEVLGVGGMAEVYSATHLSNGRRAAIKLLRREWLSRPNVVYRFLREGYVANRIRHPGAVAILDDGTADDGMPFLVLELLDGCTMNTHIRDRLPIRTVLWIASEILDVLAVAHEEGIVHRDIKPDNVLLTRQGSVKVLDFGIARMRELAGNGGNGSGTGTGTQVGMMMGTPAYMPPEQARGRWEAIDARTDVWAVGATMFVLLSGRSVHLGGTSNETLMSAMREPAPRLRTVAPEVSAEIGEIVDRALAFAREDRWPSARRMQAEIRAVLERMDQPKRRGGTAAVLRVAAASALVVSLAFVARARAAQPDEVSPPDLTVHREPSAAALFLAPRAMNESPAVPSSPGGPAPSRPKATHRPHARTMAAATAVASAPAVAAPPPAPEDPLDRRE